jgi:hypothetical protein
LDLVFRKHLFYPLNYRAILDSGCKFAHISAYCQTIERDFLAGNAGIESIRSEQQVQQSDSHKGCTTLKIKTIHDPHHCFKLKTSRISSKTVIGMKRILLLTFVIALGVARVNGQAVPNPSFELWDNDTTEIPAGWFNSNLYAQLFFGAPNVTKSSDAHGGQFAARMETFANANDSLFGYIANCPGDPNSGQGGVPYSQQPTQMRGWVKYDLVPGDTSIVIVLFKSGGTVLSTDYYSFTGTANTYTYFQMPLTLSAMPDSVVIAMGSSFADGPGLANGSWILVDDLSFDTPNPIPNGDFENWSTSIRSEPFGWSSPDMYGDTAEVVTRTTDAITGQYAARIETQAFLGGQDTIGYMTTGVFTGGNQAGGQPYTHTTDTLCGFYKYDGMGSDSAIIGAVFFTGGTLTNVAAMVVHDQPNYLYFEIPFQIAPAPDTVRIDIWSSHPNGNPLPGSVLIIDSLRFKSDPLVGILAEESQVEWVVFPNPVQDVLWLEAIPENAGNYTLEAISMTGQKMLERELELAAGFNRIPLSIEGLASGMYVIRLKGYGSAIKVLVE